MCIAFVHASSSSASGEGVFSYRTGTEEHAMGRLIGMILVIWLLVGALAAYQRDYFSDQRDVSCKQTSDTVLTVLAGPLNYVGVNPKVKCTVPQPSK
jgi:hypothetical protein